MKYVYPKLSSKDYCLFRGGGAGLGNILFTYARAVIYARKNDCQVIWPTWPSLKIGPILRGEKDKRIYADLFRNHSGYIDGFRKISLLKSRQVIKEKDVLAGKVVPEESIIEFTGFDDCFTPILEDSQQVREDIIRNLHKKNRKAVEFAPQGAVCLHVRLGDFDRVSWEDVLAGRHCSALPIEWYVRMIEEVRRIAGRSVKAYIFSDGTDEELKMLLDMPDVERISFHTAIADILALSNAKVFIASGSSFSMWARYLGRMTTIMFPNQVKQKILFDDEQGREIVALDKIDPQWDGVLCDCLGC